MAVNLDPGKIDEIVERVVQRLGSGPSGTPRASAPVVHGRRRGIFDDLDAATAAAQRAHEELVNKLKVEDRLRMVQAMRDCALQLNESLARQTVAETGLGRVDSKIIKLAGVAKKTPGPEILQPIAYSGDDGLTLTEWAPWGVIGSITPTTNPTETILCNAIGMISAGNAVVFNVHPGAKKVSADFVVALNDAIVAAGGPENLLCSIGEPTIQSAQALMKHPGIRLLVVTGGPAVVAEAMKSGKRTIAAGPGNPPCVIDETAHLRQATRHAIDGASLDNNIVCIAEKEFLVVADVADLFKREACAYAAVEMNGREISALEKLVLTKDGHVNKDWVGRDAAKIAAAIGRQVPDTTRILLCEVEEKHPFVQEELLMPVLPLVRVRTVDEGIEIAVRVEHGFRHTAAMHSTNIESLHKMARAMNCSIFVKNAPTYAGLGYGGEGYCTFTIASPTGEGLTMARHFARERRCTLKDYFRIV